MPSLSGISGISGWRHGCRAKAFLSDTSDPGAAVTIRFRTSPEFGNYGKEGFPRLAPRPSALISAEDVFPGRLAPAIRADGDGGFLTETMRWGFPPFKGTRPVCHVANATSIYWRPWLKPPWRCAIPASAFSEYGASDHKAHWFGAASGDVLWLAGLWRPLSGKRTLPLSPADIDPRVFALVNAPPNRMIADHHPASMPTILRPSELETWLLAPRNIAFELRRPFNAGLLRRLN
jgi:putative SOS response-associated peptidase YedK